MELENTCTTVLLNLSPTPIRKLLSHLFEVHSSVAHLVRFLPQLRQLFSPLRGCSQELPERALRLLHTFAHVFLTTTPLPRALCPLPRAWIISVKKRSPGLSVVIRRSRTRNEPYSRRPRPLPRSAGSAARQRWRHTLMPAAGGSDRRSITGTRELLPHP